MAQVVNVNFRMDKDLKRVWKKLVQTWACL